LGPEYRAKNSAINHAFSGCGAAFTGDSVRLITGSGDGRVTVWEAEDGSLVKELFHGGPVDSVMFSTDGSLVITADGGPHIWYMPQLGGGGDHEVFSLRGHNAEAVAADVSADGKLFLTFGPSDRTVRVWDIAGGAHMMVFGEPDKRVGDVLFSSDGSKILTSGDLMQIWAAKTAQHLSTMKIPAYISSGEQFSKDATRLLAHCLKGSLCVFDTTSGALVWKIDDVHTIESAFSSDGKLVAVAGEDHALAVYDTASGNRRVFVGDGGSPTSIVFSPDGREVLAAFRGDEYAWDIASGQQVRKFKGYGALFSPDRGTIATVQGDVARWYDAATGRVLKELKISAEAIATQSFSHDSALLAAGSTDGLIKVWEVKTGREVLSLRPEDGRVRVLQFSADGKDLIAATDGAIHVYSIGNGNEWQTFHNNFGLTNSAVSPDGTSIVAVDTRRRALLYSLKFADLFDAAQRRRPAVGSAEP
jgi:WD40 repeat protein